MLSTEIAGLLALIAVVAACLLSVLAVFFAFRAAQYARTCADYTKDRAESSHVGDLERSLTELWDSHASLLASHKRLRSKYGMRDLRERKKEAEIDGAGDPGDDADRLQLKKRLRLEAKKSGLLR